MVGSHSEAELSSALMEFGELCVIMVGIIQMQSLCVIH